MTSIRKTRYPSLEHKPIAVKSDKKDKKKLVSFKKGPDRLSFSDLAKILTSGERLSMLNAVDRLRGRSRILVELALFSNFPFVRLAAVTNLSNDVEALEDIAKYCHYEDTRASALDELSANLAALVEVACSSLFGNTRVDAANMIVDPHSLATIASKSPNKDSRDLALRKISDNKAALKRVAEESAYRPVRMEAFKNLATDVRTLCALAISKNEEVKKAAVSKLSNYVDEIDDMDALVEIAKHSSNEDARYIAVGRISNDPISLRTVISDSEYSDAKSTALMLLSDMVANVDDSGVLADVAILSPYQDCRAAAVDKLVGHSAALLDVANKGKFKDSRDLAVDKLKGDVSALKSVSRLSKYSDTRKKAHKLVSHPEVFASELTKILG
ncbi:Uncharacterised protein [Candidatus Bilamarchaeum dharawalense]|uniref:HEAT repeats n=1 Tax=Candidatus Bilamarchaeum dharawalense TaxID=2885759 RepID=A0A5E4LSA7_9ARCH|nr:Uncharacterised protein [Candidatus Bilamarchaeum dharawalense]